MQSCILYYFTPNKIRLKKKKTTTKADTNSQFLNLAYIYKYINKFTENDEENILDKKNQLILPI